MNIRAEKALRLLPTVIDQIDMGIVYTFQYGFYDPPTDEQPDETFKNFKVDMTYLLKHCLETKIFTPQQIETLKLQITSPDKENWLLAFVVIEAKLNGSKRIESGLTN